MNYWYHLTIGLFAFVFVQRCCWQNYFWSLAPKCPLPPSPSALHLLCSFITSQDFNIRFTFQFLVQAATVRVWVAQERDMFLKILEESCPRREGEL